MRAPKKYLDRDRTEVSPEWLEWREATRWDGSPGSLFGDEDTYFPDRDGKDLGEGSWIFVIDPPQTVQSATFQVPVLSIWWARPHRMQTGSLNGVYPYQAIITTPAGDLHLWPREYTLCPNPETFFGMEGTHLHSLGGKPVLDEDVVFYLQSRGIDANEAAMLLLPQIAQGDFMYVTLDEEYVEFFRGVGVSRQRARILDIFDEHPMSEA